MFKKVLLSVASIAAVWSVVMTPTFAQEATSTDASEAQTNAELIQILTEQVAALQQQISELLAEQQQLRIELEETRELTRQLAEGATGDDVTALQEFLASDPEIYPEGLVTGYFGPLTEQAIERLQERFGIEQVGEVGPRTRSILNVLLSKQGKDLREFFVDEDEVEDEDVNIDLTELPSGAVGVKLCHKSGPGKRTIAVAGPALQAHLAHGDDLGSCEDEDEDEEEDEEENEDAAEDAEDAIKDAEEEIADAEEEIEEEGEDGADTATAESLLAEARDLLAQAQEAFDAGDYTTAEEFAESAEDLAKDAENAIGEAEDEDDEDEDDDDEDDESEDDDDEEDEDEDDS